MLYEEEFPHIAAEDLRAPVQIREHEDGEIVALRASVATLTERVEALEADAEESRERELKLRSALRHVALARRRRRRRLISGLRAEGLL